MTLKFSLAAIVMASALVLGGCASNQSSAIGTWGNPDVPSEPSLELSKDGKVTGTDGCNRLMGSYTVDENEIAFEGVASTLMFCEGVDTWLAQLATATVSADEMTVFDLNGAEIGTLERAE